MSLYTAPGGQVTIMAPPDGYVLDFDHPQRQYVAQLYWASGVLSFITILFVAQRLFTNLWITRKWFPEDGLMVCGWGQTLCLFQAMPAYYIRLSEEHGGNVMGLAQHLKGRNAISMLLFINVEDEIREYGYEVARDYMNQVNDYAKSLDGHIDWAYLNYADEKQNPLASLEDPQGIAKTALKYDPDMVFQKRTPGFKISKV